MAKKITKASKRRLFVFGLISLSVIAYFFIATATDFIRIINLKKNYNELENNLTALKENEKNLKVDITKLQDPDYLARYARENYSYSKDGEIIIKIDEKDSKDINKNNSIDYEKYIIYGLIGICLIILFFVLKPKKNKRKKNTRD